MEGGAESVIRAHHDAADFHAAVTEGLRAYGREIFGFLVATMQSEHDASDVFSQFSIDLWSGIAAFRWQSSFRTWAYTLARHASARFHRDPYAKRAASLSEVSGLSQLVQEVRSDTAPFLKSDVKTRAAELRDRLDPDDRALLILRVDKQLAWDDIARVLGGESDESALARSSASLRKQFERIKDALREMARAEKLLE